MSDNKTNNDGKPFPTIDELFSEIEATAPKPVSLHPDETFQLDNKVKPTIVEPATIQPAVSASPIIAPPPLAPPVAPHVTPQTNSAAPLSPPAHSAPSGQSEHVNMRTQNDFFNAQRHSRMVKRFKILFPIIAGIILFALIGIGLFYRQLPDNVSVNSAAISDGNLVMESPNLDGFDDDNRPYSVKADRAIQSLENPDVINLEGIHAQLPLDDKNFAKIDANNGIYNNKAKTLRLTNDIELNSTNGFVVKLKEADIDIQSGKLISNAPVFVDSPTGAISADSLEIMDNGKRIIFKDNVKLTIQPAN